MAKSNETFNKKEKEKKRLKKQQEKKEKAEQRKAHSSKGKGLEDMMAYLDENGNITATRPTVIKQRSFELSDVAIATPRRVDEPAGKLNTGVISFFNTSQGFGFIRDSQTKENVFFHVNGLTYDAKENDQVVFATERGPRGLQATQVAKQ
jgi:cold shock CspA family protein